MIRIYDAEFETPSGTAHEHLGKFWWTDDHGHSGWWTREDAYQYVRSNAEGTVRVAEGSFSVLVYAFYSAHGTHWIQTKADGVLKDNLLTLARRHAAGLPNR